MDHELFNELCLKFLLSELSKSRTNKYGPEVFFFPDENHPITIKPLGDSEMSQGIEDDENWEEEFCILEREAGSGILVRVLFVY